MVLALTLTLVLVLTLVLAPSGMISKKGVPYFCPSTENPRFSDQKFKMFENFGTDLGWFVGALGVVWGHFRDDFGPTLKNQKILEFRIEKLTLKRPQIHLKINKKSVEKSVKKLYFSIFFYYYYYYYY